MRELPLRLYIQGGSFAARFKLALLDGIVYEVRDSLARSRGPQSDDIFK